MAEIDNIPIIQFISLNQDLVKIPLQRNIFDLTISSDHSIIYNTELLINYSDVSLTGINPQNIKELRTIVQLPARKISSLEIVDQDKALKGSIAITLNGYDGILIKKNENIWWFPFKNHMSNEIYDSNAILEHMKHIQTNASYDIYISQHAPRDSIIEVYIANHFHDVLLLKNSLKNSFDLKKYLLLDAKPHINPKSFIFKAFMKFGMDMMNAQMKKSNKVFTKKKSIQTELMVTFYHKALSISFEYWKVLKDVLIDKLKINKEGNFALLTEFKQINKLACENFNVDDLTQLSLKAYSLLEY